MGMFGNVKKNIRNWFFRKEMQNVSRVKKAIGFDAAKKIGILFDCSREEHYREVLGFVKHLERQGKTVFALGYIRQNKMPLFTMAQPNLAFCQRSDFSFSLKFKNPQLQNFSRSGFDLLIDLSPNDLFHLKLVAGLSDATFKAGTFHHDYVEVYDLMIRESENATIGELTQHMLKYLKMINPEKNEK